MVHGPGPRSGAWRCKGTNAVHAQASTRLFLFL
jgi:hypothetical protein